MMKSLLSKVLLTSTLLVSSSFAATLLEAEGSGSSAAAAKKEALTQLSSMIMVKVNSEVSSELQSDSTDGKERVFAKRQQKSKITSDSYLVGVSYEEELKAPDEPYRFRAILSDEAVKKSIISLRDALDTNLDTLTQAEMQELLKKSDFLLTLITYKPGIIQKEPILQKREYLVNALHNARVEVRLFPNDAQLFIDEKEYKADDVIFLSAGKHTLLAKKEGYLPANKTIYAQVGKKSEVKLSLIKKSALPATMAIKGVNGLLDDVKRELLKYGIKYDPTAKDVMEFSSDHHFIAEVAGMRVYNLVVISDWKRNGTLIQSKKAKIKSIPQVQLRKKEMALLKALLKAQIKAYSKK